MGSACTTKFKVNEDLPGQGMEVMQIAKVLRFEKRDLDKLYANFCKIDVSGDAVISVSEFIVVNKISCDPLGEMIFKLVDKDHNNSVDFIEYMVALWNYCR